MVNLAGTESHCLSLQRGTLDCHCGKSNIQKCSTMVLEIWTVSLGKGGCSGRNQALEATCPESQDF